MNPIKTVSTKPIVVMNCFYCKKELRGHAYKADSYYLMCHDCKCKHITRNGILISLSLYDNSYSITLNFVENTSTLSESIISGGSQVYTSKGVAPITPQNIRNKIKTWLIMQ
jgi:hypothetical protein